MEGLVEWDEGAFEHGDDEARVEVEAFDERVEGGGEFTAEGDDGDDDADDWAFPIAVACEEAGGFGVALEAEGEGDGAAAEWVLSGDVVDVVWGELGGGGVDEIDFVGDASEVAAHFLDVFRFPAHGFGDEAFAVGVIVVAVAGFGVGFGAAVDVAEFLFPFEFVEWGIEGVRRGGGEVGCGGAWVGGVGERVFVFVVGEVFFVVLVIIGWVHACDGVDVVVEGVLVGEFLSGAVVAVHFPECLAEGDIEVRGLDDDAAVGIAEPFEVEDIGEFGGDGFAFGEEVEEIGFADGGDACFAGSGHVADGALLDRGEEFEVGERFRVGVFEGEDAACEIAEAIAEEFDDERGLEAEEPEATGDLAADFVREFTADHRFFQTNGHEVWAGGLGEGVSLGRCCQRP